MSVAVLTSSYIQDISTNKMDPEPVCPGDDTVKKPIACRRSTDKSFEES